MRADPYPARGAAEPSSENPGNYPPGAACGHGCPAPSGVAPLNSLDLHASAVQSLRPASRSGATRRPGERTARYRSRLTRAASVRLGRAPTGCAARVARPVAIHRGSRQAGSSGGTHPPGGHVVRARRGAGLRLASDNLRLLTVRAVSRPAATAPTVRGVPPKRVAKISSLTQLAPRKLARPLRRHHEQMCSDAPVARARVRESAAAIGDVPQHNKATRR